MPSFVSSIEPVLEASNLSKRFGRRLLFHKLSLRVRGGETVAVTGANGSGKSTLLRILAGVMTPTDGEVSLWTEGAVVPAERHPMHVGLVAPYLNVYDGFTPHENLHFIARARGLAGAEARIRRMLERVELDGRSEDMVSTFSSGMKQRVKFAAALLCEPPLLLLDEPNVNLDAAGQEMVRSIVEDQTGAGGIVVVATNDDREEGRHDRALRVEDFR